MSFWFTCTPTHHQELIPWRIYGVMVCAAASEATACSLLSRWWIEVWLILRTVSETQWDRMCPQHGSLVSHYNWRESTHAWTHKRHTYQNRHPALCPCGLLVTARQSWVYVRKRLVSEPGVQSEPHCLWWALYMLKLLKDIKKRPLFACLTWPR